MLAKYYKMDKAGERGFEERVSHPGPKIRFVRKKAKSKISFLYLPGNGHNWRLIIPLCSFRVQEERAKAGRYDEYDRHNVGGEYSL